MFDVVGDGDFLIFDATKIGIKKAHDRRSVHCGSACTVRALNRTVPAGVLSTYSFTGNLLTEDVSDLVLTTGVPFTNGVLHYPEIPGGKALPALGSGGGEHYVDVER